MKHKWTSNLSLKFLSLFVAFLIWLLVANVNNPTRSLLYRDVKIDIINEDSVTEIDKVLDIVSEDTVTIKVTAPKYVHETLTKDSFTVIADMENLSAMNTVPLTVTCSNPSVSWANMEIVPSTLKVELVWELADFFNGLMVIPNALALLALSGVVVQISKKFGKKKEK